MNNESQEKEIVIGTDLFEKYTKNDLVDTTDSYWYELGIIPNEVNSRGFRYTQFHIDMVNSWLNDVIEGKILNGSFVPLYISRFPSDNTIDFTNICARIKRVEIVNGKTWIEVIPVGPMAKLFVEYNQMLKIVTFMMGSISSVDGINTVNEDTQMIYFFLTQKESDLPTPLE